MRSSGDGGEERAKKNTAGAREREKEKEGRSGDKE